jgi:hypothetical protein
MRRRTKGQPIGGVEAEGLQQLRMVLGAAGLQHVEIALGEARIRTLVAA